MLLRKFMSLMGVGSSQIDLILEKETYKPNEQVKGHFFIKGGIIEQDLKRIDCDFVMVNEKEETEEVVDDTTILLTESIESEGDKKIPFIFQLPKHIHPSDESHSYKFKTRLIFKQGVESMDTDEIKIIKG